ncbi:MAG TPA: ABC transporter substrate-binding protein, partial [Thermomicrobiaceae bacterium]|nr:ABC transporter substrate-binding protein [Thermomicrobiaceae bacterium]
ALDRSVFVKQVTAGLASVANSFFPKGTLDWDASLSLPYDLTRAKQLMSQSKYPSGYKGLTLQYSSGDTLGHDNAVIAQQMWSQIGLQFTIQQVDASTLAANWYKSDYESISGYQWTNGMADPEQLVEFFFVTPRMNSGYQPAQSAINLVNQAQQELDPAKRQQDFYQLQQIYNQDVGGTISLYYTPLASYVGNNVQGFYRSPLGFPFFWETWLGKA